MTERTMAETLSSNQRPVFVRKSLKGDSILMESEGLLEVSSQFQYEGNTTGDSKDDGQKPLDQSEAEI